MYWDLDGMEYLRSLHLCSNGVRFSAETSERTARCCADNIGPLWRIAGGRTPRWHREIMPRCLQPSTASGCADGLKIRPTVMPQFYEYSRWWLRASKVMSKDLLGVPTWQRSGACLPHQKFGFVGMGRNALKRWIAKMSWHPQLAKVYVRSELRKLSCLKLIDRIHKLREAFYCSESGDWVNNTRLEKSHKKVYKKDSY